MYFTLALPEGQENEERWECENQTERVAGDGHIEELPVELKRRTQR